MRIVGPSIARIPTGRVLPIVDSVRRFLPPIACESLEFIYSGVAFLRLLYVWAVFKPEILYERFNLFQPAGVLLKKLTGIPFLVEVNAPLLEERSLRRRIYLGRLAAWSSRVVLQQADRILPVTRSLAAALVEGGASPHKMVVVPNGADDPGPPTASNEDHAKKLLGLECRTVIGFVGFVRDWHKLEWAIDLITREGESRNLHLLVIGDIGEAAGAVSNCPRYRLTITGPIASKAVSQYLAAVDIAVQPGVTEYASPLKIFEYMARARAIVAPNSANIMEVLNDKCALLFQSGKRSQFDDAVLSLCDDPNRRRALGWAARERFIEMDLTWHRAAKQVHKIASQSRHSHYQDDQFHKMD